MYSNQAERDFTIRIELRQQVAALTTERDNLASLVAEMRAALEAWSEWCEEETWAGEALDKATMLTENLLSRTPEQARERMRVLEEVARCAAWWVAASNRYYEQRTVGFDDEVQDTEMANEMMLAEEATEAAVKVLAALGVKRAE